MCVVDCVTCLYIELFLSAAGVRARINTDTYVRVSQGKSDAMGDRWSLGRPANHDEGSQARALITREDKMGIEREKPR